MKGIKISKTGWIILSAGIFIVVLAGLGITRSGQVKQQSKLGTDLATSQLRLDKLDTSQSQMQLDELEQQLADSTEQLTEVKGKLLQKIESVDVTDKFYEIAAFYSVNVTILGTTRVAKDDYQGVPCSVISLTATASGNFTNIVDFIAGLNNNYTTGFVQTAQIQVVPVSTDSSDNSTTDNTTEPDISLTDADINLIVYSYEGS